MLNDDDEEIRDLAASTTSRLLSHSDVSPSKAIILDYVNSRDLLATFISQNYSTSQCLPDKILQYINGQKSRASGSVSPGKPIPVSNLISELRKESTILFVEEKQNLFIDEVCELDVWTKNLFRIADSSYDSSTIIEVCAWVSNGLSCLIELVGDEAGRDGLLGWASKPELFTLGVRVISIAAMLASKNFPASKLLGHRQDTLKEGLKALVDTGRGAALHPEWLSRAEKALEL